MDNDEPQVGQFTGLPLDLPPGQHPFDWYLSAMTRILGHRTTARYLGYELVPREPQTSEAVE